MEAKLDKQPQNETKQLDKQPESQITKATTQELTTLRNTLISPEQQQLNQQQFQEITQQIAANPKFQEVQEPKLKTLFQEGKILEAFKLGFSVLRASIFGEKEGEIGFPLFSDVDTWLKNAKLEEKSEAELHDLLKLFTDQLASIQNVKQKIAHTKAISHIKDRIFSLQHPNLKGASALEKQLSQELEVGSIILLNKKKSGFGGELLQNLAKNDIDMTHVIVITDKGPPLQFSHSTEKKFKNEKSSGVETDVGLVDYLGSTPSDFIVLKPTNANQQLIQQNLEKLKNASYSYFDAALAAIGSRGSQPQQTSFNCGSYVAAVLGINSHQENDLALPNNWLNEKTLMPQYMRTWQGLSSQ